MRVINLLIWIRYPDDPHDRIWIPLTMDEWSAISTTNKVQNGVTDIFEAPSAVMQTAATPTNSSRPIVVAWDVKPSAKDKPPGYVHVLEYY
jgi:hypothetical protein